MKNNEFLKTCVYLVKITVFACSIRKIPKCATDANFYARTGYIMYIQ